jgi:hypothetical protein
VPEFFNSFVGGEFAAAYLLEKAFQFRGVHGIRLTGRKKDDRPHVKTALETLRTTLSLSYDCCVSELVFPSR